MTQIMEMKKELEQLKKENEKLNKENEKLKKEKEELKKENEEYFDDRSWFINHPLIDGSEIEVEWYKRKGMMSDDEEEDDEEEEDDGCSYNFYICRYCFAFATDDPDCSKCGKEMCVLLYQEKNAALALAKAKQN